MIACLQMLTVDACVSPSGDLVVACHSGPPDWGTGPTGIGKLFRIRMNQPAHPRPIAAWAAGPSELQIAFDQPLDITSVRGLALRAVVQFGLHVRAGDRFENLVPPYAVVRQQQMQPRFELPVHSVALSPDGRTLSLNTDVITQNVHHSIMLPLGDEQLDIDARLNGVQASWTANGDDQPSWNGYLPHLDPSICQQLLGESAHHAALWPMLKQDGKLRLETKIDVRSMLRPAIQAGAKIDYTWPEEQIALQFNSTSLSKLLVGQSVKSPIAAGTKLAEVQVENSSDWIEATVEITTQRDVPAKLFVSFSTAEDETRRPLSLSRFLQPWAPTQQVSDGTKSTNSIESVPELAGGSWGRGRRLFHDERTLCARCHAIGGDGAKVGPDLGNLIHRDYASVLRDILEPSRTINPDYLNQTVLTKDGRAISGVVSSEGDKVVVADSKGTLERISRDEIEQMKSLTTSVMPQELLAKLTESERRDLLTYLLTPPPTMPLDSPLPRRRSEHVLKLLRPCKAVSLCPRQ
ncbi:MAG: c-type cytochrome [Pirellulales bacterium]